MSPNQCQNYSLKDAQTKSLIRFSVLINSENLLCALLHLGIHRLFSFGFWRWQIPQNLSKSQWNQTWYLSEHHPALSPAPSQFSFWLYHANPTHLKPAQSCWEFTSPSKMLDWANFVTGAAIFSFPSSLLLPASAWLQACQGPPMCESLVALILKVHVCPHPFYIDLHFSHV